MQLQELKQSYQQHTHAAEGIFLKAATEKRDYTVNESRDYEMHMDRANALHEQIKAVEGQNTILSMIGSKGIPKWIQDPGAKFGANRNQKQMSPEYAEAFLSFVRSGGKRATSELSEGFDPMFGGYALPALPSMSAASYEGSPSSGGYGVTVPTDQNIVPLGIPDLAVRGIARVIPTANDVKIPRGTAFPTATLKGEGDGTGVNVFTTSSSTLDQFTLSAFMQGVANPVSWELMQDVQTFQEFAVSDLIRSVNILEEAYFVTGTGVGQPQGLVGNVGTGTGAPYVYESTGKYLLDALDDVLGTLKEAYFANSVFLMTRATGAAIVKAQRQANLFDPVWTRENGRNYLHGFPVSFSQSVPSIPTATTAGVTPILFGSFSDGYVVGDRGGSGVFVKILDQPKALEGMTVLLCYRRSDGRVRRSEAIQAITISHS